MGRETFVLPMRWNKGWPEILPRGKPVPLTLPEIIPTKNAQTDWSARRDDFNSATLASDWLSLRGRDTAWHSLTETAGALTLKATSEPITEKGFPAFMALRQRHQAMSFTTKLSFTPHQVGGRAGLLAFADEAHYFFFGIEKLPSGSHIVVRRRSKSADPTAGELLAVSANRLPDIGSVQLRISADGPDYDFTYALSDGADVTLLKKADGRILATEYAGLLFTGTIIGPYAASNARQ